MDLFGYKAAVQLKKDAPLSDRMRPETLAEFVGQRELVGEGTLLRTLIERDEVPSMIFWGPPGTGKTTLARLIAKLTKSHFVQLSAVSSGVADLRATIAEAQERLKSYSTRTIVFVDEIHRWNKAQQDAFLPYVEDGTVTLIGATTENPSFEVNAALLSRCRVFVLQKLEIEDIATLVRRAAADGRRAFAGREIELEDGVAEALAGIADGDARTALNSLELAVKAAADAVPKGKTPDAVKSVRLRRDDVARAVRRTHLLYDKSGEEHYNLISALHKSLRGSDADAALYWLGRMLESGEDPLYVARRLVRFASEDVGLADPQALVQANAAFQAAHVLGMPECDVCLAQATVYLARAPKSVAVYRAVGRVKEAIAAAPNDPVPPHLRNAPTKLMKELGYGRGYVYTPDAPETAQDFLPPRLKNKKFLN